MFMDLEQKKASTQNQFKCQIPIFGQVKEKDTWHLGKAILSNYYTIFDADKLDQANGGYL